MRHHVVCLLLGAAACGGVTAPLKNPPCGGLSFAPAHGVTIPLGSITTTQIDETLYVHDPASLTDYERTYPITARSTSSTVTVIAHGRIISRTLPDSVIPLLVLVIGKEAGKGGVEIRSSCAESNASVTVPTTTQ